MPESSDMMQAEVILPESEGHFSKREWGVVAIALAQAVLWMIVFWPSGLFRETMIPGLRPGFLGFGLFWPAGFCVLPGVGLTLVELAGFGAVLLVMGKRARIDRVTVPLMVACGIMSLFPVLFGNGTLRLLNCLVLWVVGTYTLFLVANIWPRCKLGAASLLRSLGLFFRSLFSHILKPVRAIGPSIRFLRATKSNGATATKGTARSVVLGCAVAACVLVAVVPLLASADAVYGSALSQVWHAIAQIANPYESFGRTAYVLTVGPFLFSLLWGFAYDAASYPVARDGEEPRTRFARSVTPLSAAIVVAALDVVYALFVAVQFVYLFGGAESAAMHGGFAEYARSGFFQLVAVVGINVVVGLLAVRFASTREESSGESDGDDGASRAAGIVLVLVLALVALTFVILASAYTRMSLYIGAFGLTVLRCLTLLGMAFAAVLLVALVVKVFKRDFPFFATFLYAGAALWIAFNLVNVDARIADYNVDRYLGGQLEQLDTSYFFSLSPDARPAIERLAAAEPDDFFANEWLSRISYASNCSWQMQCLAYR